MTALFQDRVNQGADGSFFVRAPAKLNLFLHITGRRDDGYHILESLFVFTRRGDLLRFHPSDNFDLKITGHFKDQLESVPHHDNLIWKAAHALADHAGVNCTGSIELEKNLPVASGIGGGSADAAAALIGLSALWNLNLGAETVEEIALSIGADVPACLHSRPSIVEGIGEKLTPVTLPWTAGVVIVNPLKQVSTSDVFSNFKAFREERRLPIVDVSITDLVSVVDDLSMIDVLTGNSLQDAAARMCTEIMEVERFLRLNSQSELVRMSGSGASVFALYHDKQAAEAVARRVREQMPQWWVMADEIGG